MGRVKGAGAFTAICFLIILLSVAMPISVARGADAPTDPVVAHLEYLGYQCDLVPQGIRARHGEKVPFVVSYGRGGVSLQTGFPGKSESADEAKRFALLNAVNARVQVAHVFWTNEGDLFLSAWMPGLYEKSRFAAFLEAWERDIQVLRELGPELQPFLVDRSQEP
jgi:hypothetical protein